MAIEMTGMSMAHGDWEMLDINVIAAISRHWSPIWESSWPIQSSLKSRLCNSALNASCWSGGRVGGLDIHRFL